MRRRVAGAVVAVALLAVCITAMATGASALEPVTAVMTTTSTMLGAVGDALGATPVADSSSSTTTTSTPAATSTSTSSTTSSTSTSTTLLLATATTTTTSTTLVARQARESSTTSSPATTSTATARPVIAAVATIAGPLPAPQLLPEAAIAALHQLPPALDVPKGPRSTLDVIDVLAQRSAPPSLVARLLAPFPVAGKASYTNDWHLPRHGPPAHLHEGTDIFAARGTPVIASMDGVIGHMTTTSSLGGTALRVTLESGTYFYYAHLDHFAAGIGDGDAVRAGQVIGFVGDTGDAIGGPTHLHFEIHPHGGPAVPPVPYLDRWLAEARATAWAISPSPALGAILHKPAAADAALVAPAAPTSKTSALSYRTLSAQPAGSVNPMPMLVLALVVALFSWCAQLGRRRNGRTRGARR